MVPKNLTSAPRSAVPGIFITTILLLLSGTVEAQLISRACASTNKVDNLESDLLSETEVLLSWDDVPGALDYEIKVRVHGSRTQDVVMRTAFNSLYFNDLPDGKIIHWGVSAFCASGETSSPAVPDTFAMPDMEFRCGDLLVDMRDQKYYRTVKMGSQCWTKDNAFFSLGEDAYGFSIGAGCTAPWKVGGYYSWTAAKMVDSVFTKDSYLFEGEQGVCPAGWHVPTILEYDVLFADTSINVFNVQPGGDSGFDLAFSGFMNTSGNFVNAGKGTILLSSTEAALGRMWAVVVDDHFTYAIEKGQIVKNCRGAVRCIKD